MSLVALPVSFPLKRRIPWVPVLFVAVAVVGVAWIAMALMGGNSGGPSAMPFYTVVPMDMDITISKDGELGACNNVEVNCPVEGQNVILDIVKEGTFVHK